MLKKFSGLLLALALFAAIATAAPIVTVTFDGAPYGSSGPYLLTVDGFGQGLWECYTRDRNVQGTFQAYLVATNDLSLPEDRFAFLPNALADYDRAAWLSAQFNTADPANFVDLHDALWDVFTNDGGPNTAGSTAYSAASLGQFSTGWKLIPLDFGVDGSQSFIQAPKDLVANPEPATFAISGIGLLALGFYRRRKR